MDISDDVQQQIRSYFTDPASRQHIENALAAHLLVHTACKLDGREVLARAVAGWEFVSAAPESIQVAAIPRSNSAVMVSLKINAHGSPVRLRTGIEMVGEELPIRLTHGTKPEREAAWEHVFKTRSDLVREEYRDRRSKRAATIDS